MTESTGSAPRRILVADDEESLRVILAEALEEEGFVVTTARDGNEALELVKQERYEIVLSDIRMPGMSGIELLTAIKAFDPRIQVIIMTSHASLETSLEAIRNGAYDYILKPFQDLASVGQMVRNASEQIRLVERNEELIRNLKAANAKLSESNELLAARAATIAALLDFSQAISALLSPEQFASETVRAASKLGAGRPTVFFRMNQSSRELVPIASAAVDRTSLRPIPAAGGTGTERQAREWLEGLEARNDLGPGLLQTGPSSSCYLSPVIASGRLYGAVAVFESQGPFPPSTRSVLDRFMHQVRQTADNIALHESMRALAIRDGLTGLYNHRYFQDRLLEEFSRARRHGHPLSVIFLDIDHFKPFNDTYGHPKGDALLRAMARLLRTSGRGSDVAARGGASSNVTEINGRESDIAARYGGEEFVLILTETPAEGALVRAERLRDVIEKSGFVFTEGEDPLKVTVSVGVASIGPQHERADDLVLEADKAMYLAKSAGRNRVCTVQSDGPNPAAQGGKP